MKTPIYDFISYYCARDILRAHMPGHKGKAFDDRIFMKDIYCADITEVYGADSLFEADGIIRESEENMSLLYNTAGTAYSASGSTLCIQAMLAVMKEEGRRIVAVRNVHRSFLNAAALLDLDIKWILPEYDGGILSGSVSLREIDKALAECEGRGCLFITSPDYTGRIADIRSISEICRKRGARLLVDNAHGAHLAFFEKNMHPIALGADLCCDSAHKMLPALTGAAMLHTSRAEYAGKLKYYMGLFASTSPSYPVLASLDLCTDYIENHIRADISDNLRFIDNFRKAFSGRFSFGEGDPFHILIKAGESGIDGRELDGKLRAAGVVSEYSDSFLVLLLMSPINREADYRRLADSLDKAYRSCKKGNIIKQTVCPEKLPEKVMSIREAVFSPSEYIPVDDALGRICAAPSVPCPPAVPVVASGERISGECINIFRNYGILRVNVVK